MTGYVMPLKEEKGEVVMELAKEPEDKPKKKKKVKKIKKTANSST
jgi:hypothetical protein